MDKVKKKRVTVLKKAILKGRLRKKSLKESNSKFILSEKLEDDELNSGYVTIEETLLNENSEKPKIISKPKPQKKEIVVSLNKGYKTKG